MNDAFRQRLIAATRHRLESYLNDAEWAMVAQILSTTPCMVSAVRARSTKHGDHRWRAAEGYSEVTVNASGNQYQFFFTLLHELAHAVTFQTFGLRVAAHGREWRQTFSNLLKQALTAELFPEDLRSHVARQAAAPHASSSRDTSLQLAFRKYDTLNLRPLVAELAHGALFSLDGKLILRRGEKLRTRFQCLTPAGQAYRVPGTARVHTLYH